jgi:riboflavin synthase
LKLRFLTAFKHFCHLKVELVFGFLVPSPDPFDLIIGHPQLKMYRTFEMPAQRRLACFQTRSRMFTGIIERIGEVVALAQRGSNTEFQIRSGISAELKVDQSISHDGVCLTVTKVEGDTHFVTAIDETLRKSNLGGLNVGKHVNLERCMVNNGRFDGHIVQGHVDQTALVKSIADQNGSWIFTFEYDVALGNVTVEKGSIAVNGVSLTCFESQVSSFKVAIIPYTFEHTNFHELRVGQTVNLEFDIIGKYVKRLMGK